MSSCTCCIHKKNHRFFCVDSLHAVSKRKKHHIFKHYEGSHILNFIIVKYYSNTQNLKTKIILKKPVFRVFYILFYDIIVVAQV